MQITKGYKYLITTDDWFFAPDGECYKAVFGTVLDISEAKTLLGLNPTKPSTNWYLQIGEMVIAGCQLHYAIQSDTCAQKPGTREMEHNGELTSAENPISRIYFTT